MKRLLLLLLIAAAPSAAWAKAKQPVAVLAFRNLAKGDLDWLSDGIAETMINDLRKNGMRVVERDRIDDALAEMELAGTVTQATTAAKVGNLIGAKTVVVGSYQQAGKKLRITARFVRVESGVIGQTAKTTGKLSKVFDLQDQIVAKLLGRKPKVRKARRVRVTAAKSYKAGQTKNRKGELTKPKPKKTTDKDRLKAYETYVLSLQTSSKAKRMQFLRKALNHDPNFVYALDDLDKLEAKLRRFDIEKEKREDKKLAALIQTVRTGEGLQHPLMRDGNANMAMSTLFSKHRCADLMTLTNELRRNPEWFQDQAQILSMSVYWDFACLNMMMRKDEALQLGESILDEYPETHAASQAQWMLKSIIERMRDIEEKRREWPEQLAKLESRENHDKERAERFEKLKEKWPQTLARHMKTRVQRMSNYYLWAESNELGDAFLRKYPGADRQKDRHQVYRTMMWNHHWLGEFEAARAIIGRWEADGGEPKDVKSARESAENWPR